MRKLLVLIFAAGAALTVSAAATAQQRAAGPMQSFQRDNPASTLELRLRSIEIRIDILSDRGMIGREEARDLRQQSHRLAERLYRLSARDARDAELAVDRLQASLRSAADLALLDPSGSNRRDLGRFDDGDRYQRDGGYYDRDSYQPPDPRGDPFAIWDARDCREGVC
jgi:hypothetical protein